MVVVFLDNRFTFLQVLSQESLGVGQSILKLSDLYMGGVHKHLFIARNHGVIRVVQVYLDWLVEQLGVSSQRVMGWALRGAHRLITLALESIARLGLGVAINVGAVGLSVHLTGLKLTKEITNSN